jgi:hypothetical protein
MVPMMNRPLHLSNDEFLSHGMDRLGAMHAKTKAMQPLTIAERNELTELHEEFQRRGLQFTIPQQEKAE